MTFFEDFDPGPRRHLGVWDVTAEDTLAFARAYDPQRFHIDPEAAARTHFGRLSASGWQTAAQWMRAFVATMQRDREALVAAGKPVAALGPSPGFADMKWLQPVFPGDRIDYFSTFLDKRVSHSRPQFGLVRHLNEGVNQTGATVFSFIGTVFVERRTP